MILLQNNWFRVGVILTLVLFVFVYSGVSEAKQDRLRKNDCLATYRAEVGSKIFGEYASDWNYDDLSDKCSVSYFLGDHADAVCLENGIKMTDKKEGKNGMIFDCDTSTAIREF